MTASFLPGLQLSRLFYREAVRPILDDVAPGLVHSAARLGSGSEVLGFDTARSADHEWGPRLQLFLSEPDVADRAEELTHALAERLPKTFRGWPTNFEPVDEPIGSMTLTAGAVRHRVDVVTVQSFTDGLLGFDPSAGVTVLDWLATPWQRLAELTGGEVFQDGLGTLVPVRERLAWYPDDLWRHLLACQWQRIAEEEAFPGRCEEVGDELGARVELARLARDLMRLSLLMDRRYPPYSKWLGSAFARSPTGSGLVDSLRRALAAPRCPVRETALAEVYSGLAQRHNELQLTASVDTSTRAYFDRPFVVLRADRFASALRDSVVGTRCASLSGGGSVDQVTDSLPLLGGHVERRAAVAVANGID